MAPKSKAAAAAKKDAEAKKVASTESEATSPGEERPCPAQNDVLTYFRRTASGQMKKASAHDKASATEALATYGQLDELGKRDFRTAFGNAKATKAFGFIREFSDQLTSKRTQQEEITENYCTRIDITCIQHAYMP
jgi:hypothetical protein